MSQSDHDFVARARAAIEAWSGTGATTENDVTAATLWAEGFRLDGPSAPPEPLTRWFSLLPRTARNTGAVQSRQESPSNPRGTYRLRRHCGQRTGWKQSS